MIRISIVLFTLISMLLQPGFARSPAPSPAESGLSLEARIETDLKAAGFEIIPFRKWREAILYGSQDRRVVVLDAPYESIFGHRAKIEFLIIRGERQILVETKRQRVPGSVDEKLPYVYLNALNNIPEREFVLILDGKGFKPEAVAWIKSKAAKTDGFTVLSPDDLIGWLNRTSVPQVRR